MKVERSITKTNMICWVTTILLISICFMVFFLYQKYLDFNQTKRLLKVTEERAVENSLRAEAESALRMVAALRDPQAAPGEDAQRILKLLQKMSPGLDAGGNIHVIAADGTLLYAPEGSPLAAPGSVNAKRTVVPGIPMSVPPGRGSAGEITIVKAPNAGNGAKIRWHAKGYPELSWVICATRDMDRVSNSVSANINRLKIDIMVETVLIVILALAVTLMAVRIAYVIAKSINDEVNELVRRCELGLKETVSPAPDEFQFSEFGTISKAMATMTLQIRGLLAELKNAAVQSTIAKQIQGGVLSNVSHDLLSSLNGIMGMAQLLQMEQKTESERRQCVDTIMNSGKAIMTLIKNVDYAVVLDTEKFKPTMGPLKVKDLYEDIMRMMGHVLEERKCGLEWVCAQEVPDRIVSDQHLLEQILMNLIEVGLYKSCKSPLRVELSPQGASGDKTTFKFRVMIAGVGLTQAELDEILEFPYVPREYATIGLRIAICKRLTELLSGKFEIEAVNSADLAVSFRFEAAKAEAEKAEAPVAVAPVAGVAGKPISVLVVDDEPVNRLVASRMLKHLGAEATQACDGQDALRKLEEFPGFSVVFMDCQMPVMDGYTAVREIRRREAGTGRHVNIVALTGYNTPLDEEYCLEAGMDAFMSKPLMMDELKATMRKFVQS